MNSLMMIKKIHKGVKQPLVAYRYVKSIAKGHYYKIKYRILRKNVQIGKNFKVNAKMSIKGPGKVLLGDNVVVDGTSHSVTPWTYKPEAEIIVGDNVFLNGTRFGCATKIEIGDNCILADCRILDTDFHSVNPNKRNDPDYIESSPIKIGRNVWVAMGGVIIRGVTIGDDSTISAQSVVVNDVKERSLYGGNPAVFMKKV